MPELSSALRESSPPVALPHLYAPFDTCDL
jgi:hypothetical protein